MKKILTAAGIGAALLTGACATNAHADNNGYHGSKGDHDARAFWLDSSPDPMTRLSDPANYASHTCWMRQRGLSEEQIVSMATVDLHGNYIGGPVNLYMRQVRAAEYHFCPSYY